MPPIDTILFAIWGLWILAAFAAVMDARFRKPFLLGLLCPGLGHFSIGERARGLLVMIPVLALFVAGLILTDFRCVSPFDRHPLWGLLQAPTLGPTALTWVATRHLTLDHITESYAAGCVYVGIGCLLNLVGLCDLRDVALKKARPSEVAA